MRKAPTNLVPGTHRCLEDVTAAPGQAVLAVGATDDPVTSEVAEIPIAVRQC